jgi:hypothetical protein
MTLANDLVGTWRVTAVRRWRPDGTEEHPIGAMPIGFAVFDTTGRVFFQLSRSTAEGATPEAVARSFMAYFGPVTVSGDTLSVAVESASSPDDVGTTQTRAITLDGDRLTIGVPRHFQATLQREARS